MPALITWNDDLVADLRSRCAAGESARVIAAAYGITRNAIIGKCARSGLALTATPQGPMRQGGQLSPAAETPAEQTAAERAPEAPKTSTDRAQALLPHQPDERDLPVAAVERSPGRAAAVLRSGRRRAS